MQIVAFSDIHGNFEMLKLTWIKLDKLGLSPAQNHRPILNAGDNVVYGNDTNECINFLKDPKNQVISVSGNYDKNVAQYSGNEHKFIHKWPDRPEKLEAIIDASRHVSEENRQWLAELPKSQLVNIDSTFFCVNHYRPSGKKLGLFDFTPDAEFEEIAVELIGKFQVVVTGHTHTPYVKKIAGVLFVNPGSLGRPLYKPTFAVIDISESGECSGEILECLD